MKRPDREIGSPQEPPKRRWVEPVTAVLMALATLSTAWCSYQSAAWTRRANRLMNDYNALERRAGVLTLQGMQSATIHTAVLAPETAELATLRPAWGDWLHFSIPDRVAQLVEQAPFKR